MSPPLRIAMLNADTPVPTVLPKWRTYGKMFQDLLSAAASRFAPDHTIQCSEYDVKQFQYPPSLTDVDVILVTGSGSSSYDAEDWITRLDEYVLDVYTNHPRIKMFGSCFGHQVLCQSLLRDYGVRVEKDPKGFELGVREVRLERKFRERLAGGKVFGRELPESLRVQMIHGDHVVIPESGGLPEEWIRVGETGHCAMQGVYEQGRVLTFQGHFEFNRFVNMEIIKLFGERWEPGVKEEGLVAADEDDDGEFAAELVLQFMLEGEGA